MIEIINIYIEGHDYKHDLFELVKVFFREIKINFIEYEDLNRQYKYLLISKYNEKGGNTELFYKGELVKDSTENIKDINIEFYDQIRIQKLVIKKSIYDCLSQYLDRKLPWGILTGIRPVKIIHEFIDMNTSNELILKILQDHYKFERNKAKLILDVALSQRKHIHPIEKDKFSLYINIPFCPSKCSYCSFSSYAIDKVRGKVSKYIDALILELKSSRDVFKGKKLNTIYIGGGTPTSLKSSELERIILEIKNIFPDNPKEFTVEAGRPDTIDLKKLKMLKKYGVNRISINPQTFNEKTLKNIKRNHDVDSIKKTYNLAKKVGFDIINMDLILGLPGESLLELKHTLNEVKSLNPDNLTIHTLSLKKGSNFYNNFNKNDFNGSNIEKMLDMSSDYAIKEELLPYYLYRQKQILGNLENIGYAKKSKECIYNISMMEEKETILGFGLGAVTKVYYPDNDKIKRIPNFKSLYDYINRIDELIEKKRKINFDFF